MKRRTFTKLFGSALAFLGLKQKSAVLCAPVQLSSFESMTDLEFVNGIVRGYIGPKYGIGGVLLDNVKLAKYRQARSIKWFQEEIESAEESLNKKLEVWDNGDFRELFMLDIKGVTT